MVRSGESVKAQFFEYAVAKSVRMPRFAWPRRRASINSLAYGPKPGGPTDKLCGRHCHWLRPLRRTKRSDGRQRPRWKDGSHVTVESTHANESRCNEIALEPNHQNEPLVTVLQLLKRNHENNVSTRDRLARTGADARIEESVVNGEVCLALRPYGREFKRCFRAPPPRDRA
jgi:hypothetical protein